MGAVERKFEDIEKSRQWLKCVEPKPGQEITITISDSQPDDSWKEKLLSLAGAFDHYEEGEAEGRMTDFRAGFNKRFE